MATRIGAAAFNERFAHPDWEILRHRIEAQFIAPTFAIAALFVGEIATAADAAGHHPDIDLRYPGRIRVGLTTHDVGGLSEADARLAATISTLAAGHGLRVDSKALTILDIAIDALDIDLVRPFWAALLGYRELPPQQPDSPIEDLVDPLGFGPDLWFQQMDTPRRQRNRVHLDLRVSAAIAESRIAAAIAAGGRLLSDAHARAFWVLADPEGNEACICTWQDRD
jgi:4a-hydroxytetrahydrobiopterin dehydratase